jgi:hypothetical protein
MLQGVTRDGWWGDPHATCLLIRIREHFTVEQTIYHKLFRQTTPPFYHIDYSNKYNLVLSLDLKKIQMLP